MNKEANKGAKWHDSSPPGVQYSEHIDVNANIPVWTWQDHNCLAGREWKNGLTCYNHAMDPNRKWTDNPGILLSTPAFSGTITTFLCQFIINGRYTVKNEKGCGRIYFPVSMEMDAASHLPAKSCHTMHSDAGTRFLSELGVEKLEPVVNNLSGRRATIIKRPILHREPNIKRFMIWRCRENETRQLLPGPGFPPSLLGPCHRWHRRLSPVC